MIGKKEVEEAINTALTFLGFEASSLVVMISALWKLVFSPRFKDWEITTLHLMFWHRTLVFPVMPLRLAAKVHIPSPLDLTSLVSLHCAKSSFLPLANLCLLGVFWEYCRLSSFICGVLSSLYLETLTPEVDIYLMLERKIPLLYLTPTW